MFIGFVHVVGLYAYTLMVWCIGATTGVIFARSQDRVKNRAVRIKVPRSMLPS